jgi:hypothetical protein
MKSRWFAAGGISEFQIIGFSCYLLFKFIVEAPLVDHGVRMEARFER